MESATGIRHCHNGDGGDDTTNWVPSAEAGLQVGRTLLMNDAEQFGAFGTVYIQPGGTLLFVAGVAAYYHRYGMRAWPFIDFEIGLAWLDQAETAFVGRLSAGVKIPIYYPSLKTGMYLKLGAFMEGVADGVNAEPIGVHIALGAQF